MKGTHIQEGNSIDYTNSGSTQIDYGTFVLIGTKGAIAGSTIPAGATGSCLLGEVYELPKDSAAITQGAKVYYDSTKDCVTATSTSNTEIGFAFKAAAAADAKCIVKLNA